VAYTMLGQPRSQGSVTVSDPVSATVKPSEAQLLAGLLVSRSIVTVLDKGTEDVVVESPRKVVEIYDVSACERQPERAWFCLGITEVGSILVTALASCECGEGEYVVQTRFMGCCCEQATENNLPCRMGEKMI